MEVVRGCGGDSERERLYVAGFYRNHIVLVLQRSFNQEKRVAHQLMPVRFEELRRDDDVADTCLVLETQKHESLRGARSLTNNHPSGYFDKSAVPHFPNVDCSQRLELLQLCAVISDRMFSDRHSRPAGISIHSLSQRHLLQRGVVVWFE